MLSLYWQPCLRSLFLRSAEVRRQPVVIAALIVYPPAVCVTLLVAATMEEYAFPIVVRRLRAAKPVNAKCKVCFVQRDRLLS